MNLCVDFDAAKLADLMPFLDCRQVLLIGSAGESLWRSMPSSYHEREHPVDEYSIDTVINHRYGLWFAYRAVVALQCDVAFSPAGKKLDATIESPCVSCSGKPCLSACPAAALSTHSSPDLGACVDHRLSEQSDCASTCLARLACPLTQWRYADEQIVYFYQRSLASTRLWVSERE